MLLRVLIIVITNNNDNNILLVNNRKHFRLALSYHGKLGMFAYLCFRNTVTAEIMYICH